MPIIVKRSAITCPFTRKSRGLSVFKEGLKFTYISHGFKVLSTKTSNPSS